MKRLNPQIAKALALANKAHKGQTDKVGADYILHPVMVAMTVAANQGDENAITAALLHDVVEDTDYTLDDLRALGFEPEVIKALSLLTHDKSVDYMDYVRAIKPNKIARMVKTADLLHNSDASRLPNGIVSPEMRQRFDKYAAALKLLNS